MMPVIAWNALHATRILGQRDARAPGALRLRHPRRRGAMPRAARPQHGARDRAQPVHRLRRNRRHRQDGGPDRTRRSGSSSASASCCPTTQLDAILSPEAMTSPGVPGGAPCQDAVPNPVRNNDKTPSNNGGAAPDPGGADAGGSGAQHTRLFRPEDLGQLEPPDRDEWQRPDRIMDVAGSGGRKRRR